MNVGILLLGINADGSSLGGAERFFADFFDLYSKKKSGSHKLFFITDSQSKKVLNSIGKITDSPKVIKLTEVSNRFKKYIEAIDICLKCLFNRIQIVHIASYGAQYYNRVKALNSLPRFIRPKLIFNQVDAELSYVLERKILPQYDSYIKRYIPLFENIRLDGVYSWNEHFKECQEKYKWIKSQPYVEAIKTRFSVFSEGTPETYDKKNRIVFAARLTDRKKADLFVEAIYLLKKNNEMFLNEWRFFIYGKGPEREKIIKMVDNYGLKDILEITSTVTMSDVLNNSKCFVSTMEYENFPSQAINEAMARGNAIIAFNVGQTDYFVKHLKNGIIVEQQTPDALATALKYYIEHPELHTSMAEESIRLTKEVHTPENFISDIDKFWYRFA